MLQHIIAILGAYSVAAAVLLIIEQIFTDGETRKSWIDEKDSDQ